MLDKDYLLNQVLPVFAAVVLIFLTIYTSYLNLEIRKYKEKESFLINKSSILMKELYSCQDSLNVCNPEFTMDFNRTHNITRDMWEVITDPITNNSKIYIKVG